MGRNTRNKPSKYRIVFRSATSKDRQRKLKEAILKGEIFTNDK